MTLVQYALNGKQVSKRYLISKYGRAYIRDITENALSSYKQSGSSYYSYEVGYLQVISMWIG